MELFDPQSVTASTEMLANPLDPDITSSYLTDDMFWFWFLVQLFLFGLALHACVLA